MRSIIKLAIAAAVFAGISSTASAKDNYGNVTNIYVTVQGCCGKPAAKPEAVAPKPVRQMPAPKLAEKPVRKSAPVGRKDNCTSEGMKVNKWAVSWRSFGSGNCPGFVKEEDLGHIAAMAELSTRSMKTYYVSMKIPAACYGKGGYAIIDVSTWKAARTMYPNGWSKIGCTTYKSVAELNS